MEMIIMCTSLRDISYYNEDKKRYYEKVLKLFEKYIQETKLYDYNNHREIPKEHLGSATEFYYFETVLYPKNEKERNNIIMIITEEMRKFRCEIENYKLGDNNIVKSSNVFFQIKTFESEKKLCESRISYFLDMLKDDAVFCFKNNLNFSAKKVCSFMENIQYFRDRLSYAKECEYEKHIPIIPEHFDKKRRLKETYYGNDFLRQR